MSGLKTNFDPVGYTIDDGDIAKIVKIYGSLHPTKQDLDRHKDSVLGFQVARAIKAFTIYFKEMGMDIGVEVE